MKALLLATVFAVGLASATALKAQNQPDIGEMTVPQLIEAAPSLHPMGLYILAARLLRQGDGQAAANWMYAGQLRYRFLIQATDPDQGHQDRVLFSALSEQVGRPVNEYIGGNVDEWIAAINWALDWDEVNDNTLLSKTENAEALAAIRNGLVGFRDSIEARREEIPRLRTENGLPNR
jgi:hypothetical protein